MKRDPRALALDALGRIDEGAYANLVLPGMLEHSNLPERDRGFVTELVYGTTRMRRACDHLVDRFVMRPLDGPTRNALRLGAYQLHFLHTPAHAAVSATVDVAPKRSSGLVNAVLRKVASAPVAWPDDATRLSYPDWIVERLATDLGRDDAIGALEQMDVNPDVTVRDDGYVQDLASQWVVEAVGAQAGERVADTCAGPGGKATGMARSGALIAACDAQPARAGLVAANATRMAVDVAVVAADGRRPSWRPGSFDRVLVDAPCSGLGVLRRRPDARWRVEPDDVGRLADLQRDLVAAGADLVRPGGTLVYSVCTLTAAETVGIDDWLAAERPDLAPVPPPVDPRWRPLGRGAILLPQAAGTDGMYLLRAHPRWGERDLSETILVVDDEVDIATLVAMNLADEGYETHMAHRGDDAMDLALKLRPDLIVLDLMMPGLDGVEVCRMLRKDPRTTTTSIIMLTARTLPSDRIAGLEAGADDYVDKPFDIDELLARVQGRLRRARQLRQTSPLTGLPGNFEIAHRLEVLLIDNVPFALMHVDLDGFKAYNDHYGFLRGDRAIVLAAKVVGWAVADHGTSECFVGHIGGDDFAVVCNPSSTREIADAIVRSFDEQVPNLYDPDDRDRGYIEVADRSGVVTRYPFLSVSVGYASTDQRRIDSPTEAAAIAVEMKRFAKGVGGSAWAMDRRRT